MVSNFELEELRGNLAFMITAANTIDPVRFTIQDGRYFNSKYGRFQVDAERKYRAGKTNIFFYDTRMGNPLDVYACAVVGEYLHVVNKTFIGKNDLKNESIRRFLGTSAVRFLDSYPTTDNPTIIKNMVKATRGEKPVKKAGSVGAPFIWPAMLQANFGIFIIDNKFIKLEKVAIEKDHDKIYAVHKDFGRFDVTAKEARYSWGKANIFFGIVSTTTMPEEQKKRWRKIANTYGEVIDADRVISEQDQEFLKKRFPVSPAVRMTAFNYMKDFSPYEPIVIAEKIEHAHWQKHVFDLATKAPAKKTMNIMTIMIVVLVVIIAWQQFISPELSKAQTKQEQEATKNAQAAKAAAAAAAAEANNNGTSLTSPPSTHTPPSSEGEPIGVRNPIPSKAQLIVPLVWQYS